MKLLSLCTGIGGLDAGVIASFTKRGIPVETVAFAETDPYAAAVYRRHNPGIPNLGDVKRIDWTQVIGGDADDSQYIITAGYPCQPFSLAGQRKGTDDDRHLWPYIAEAVRTIRPRHVVLENVPGHRSRGFDTVLADLAEARFDVRWTSIRASDIGAPHRRERIFIAATNTES